MAIEDVYGYHEVHNLAIRPSWGYPGKKHSPKISVIHTKTKLEAKRETRGENTWVTNSPFCERWFPSDGTMWSFRECSGKSICATFALSEWDNICTKQCLSEMGLETCTPWRLSVTQKNVNLPSKEWWNIKCKSFQMMHYMIFLSFFLTSPFFFCLLDYFSEFA